VRSHDGNGLSAEDSKKVTALIKTKLSTMPPIHEIAESATYDIRMGNRIVAKFCGKCHRFTKGNKAHYTSEHKGGHPPSGGSRSGGGSKRPPNQDSKPPASSPAPAAAVVASAPVADIPAPASRLMRCDVPDDLYDTPNIGFRGPSADTSDDSDDSAYRAFVCAPLMSPSDFAESLPSLIDVDAMHSEVPYAHSPLPPELVALGLAAEYCDPHTGTKFLVWGSGIDRKKYPVDLLEFRGLPSTATAFNHCISPASAERSCNSADDDDEDLLPSIELPPLPHVVHPKARRG